MVINQAKIDFVRFDISDSITRQLAYKTFLHFYYMQKSVTSDYFPDDALEEFKSGRISHIHFTTEPALYQTSKRIPNPNDALVHLTFYSASGFWFGFNVYSNETSEACKTLVRWLLKQWEVVSYKAHRRCFK